MERTMEMETGKGCITVKSVIRLKELRLTREMLADGGIDLDDEVEIICGEGEVIIRQRSILERLPQELQEHCKATGLTRKTLERAYRMEAEVLGGVERNFFEPESCLLNVSKVRCGRRRLVERQG